MIELDVWHKNRAVGWKEKKKKGKITMERTNIAEQTSNTKDLKQTDSSRRGKNWLDGAAAWSAEKIKSGKRGSREENGGERAMQPPPVFLG